MKSSCIDQDGRRPRAGSEGERGSALVLAIFMLALLTGMGTALLFVSQVEVKMSQAALRSKMAFYLAEAGEEDGRATLFETNGNGDFSDDLVTAAGANGLIDFDPATIEAIYDPDGNVTGFTGYGDDAPLRSTTALGQGWYIAFLTNDPLDGRTNTGDGNGRVLITGVGAGLSRSFEVVQAIVEQNDIFPTIPPATITMLGPTPSFDGAHSAVKEYVGDDCRGSGIPGFYVPVVGAIGSSAEASAELGIYQNPSYRSDTYTGPDTFADLTDATEPTVIDSGYGTIHPDWLNCQYLHDMVGEVNEVADVVCVEGTACTLPPPSPDRIIFAQGDFTVGPTDSGAGLLFVTGSLTFHGRASWNGMIFVVGEGRMTRNGGGNGSISGAALVADIAGPDGIFGNSDDCSGGDGGFGQAYYDENGGGNSDTTYCTDDINPANPVNPYDVVSFLQR